MTPRTIVEKIWDSHVVTQQPGAPALLFIDQNDSGAYYWHGMIYSDSHFDK